MDSPLLKKVDGKVKVCKNPEDKRCRVCMSAKKAELVDLVGVRAKDHTKQEICDTISSHLNGKDDGVYSANGLKSAKISK